VVERPQDVGGGIDSESAAEAERFQVSLGRLWQSKDAAPALVGTPRVRIVETVESKAY
jgi:hypothetical protein